MEGSVTGKMRRSETGEVGKEAMMHVLESLIKEFIIYPKQNGKPAKNFERYSDVIRSAFLKNPADFRVEIRLKKGKRSLGES